MVAPRSRGFTLFELLITVTIVAILASFAMPSLVDLIQGAKVRTAASDLYASLLQARSEAIKARANAVVAPIGTGWTSGWTVKVGSAVYAQTDALQSGVAVQVGVPAGSPSAITYGYNGRLTGAAQQLIFYSTREATKVRSRCVSVDTNGLPRVRIDSDTDPTNGC